MGHFVQRRPQLLNQLVADGVAFVRAIKRDGGDAGVMCEKECFIVHAISYSFNPPPLNLCTALQSQLSPAAVRRRASATAASRRVLPTPPPPAPSQYCKPKRPERTDIHPSRPARNRIAGNRHHTRPLLCPRPDQAGYAGVRRSPDSHTWKSPPKPTRQSAAAPPFLLCRRAKSCARHKIRAGRRHRPLRPHSIGPRTGFRKPSKCMTQYPVQPLRPCL